MSDPSSFLRYLPGLYARQPDGFVGAYLKIFEKILTGIDDGELGARRGIQQLLAAEVMGNLFYPRLSFLFPGDTDTFIPPIDGKERDALLGTLDTYIGADPPADTLAAFMAGSTPGDPLAGITAWLEDFLAWLAGWVDVLLDSGWPLDKKRKVIAQAMALHRLRGTPQGMAFLLDLLFDMPRMVDGRTVSNGNPTPAKALASLEVVAPAPHDITVTDAYARGGSFVLRDRVTAGMPLVSGYSQGLFVVRIVLPSANDPTFFLTDFDWLRTLLGRLPAILDATKPALTRWSLAVVPSMRLEPATFAAPLYLGGNTLLGRQE